MKRRSGFMLIELLVVITVGSVMMGIAVGLLYTLMQMDGKSRESSQDLAGLARLAEQFRADVHAASAWTPLGQSAPQGAGYPGWKLQCTGDWEIEYHAKEGTLFRTETAGGQARSRESYHLPAGAVAAIQSPEPAAVPGLLRLDIVSDKSLPVKAGVRPRRIEAVLGMNHRYSQSPGIRNR